jgi:PEP-CTERM motif
MPKTMKTQLKLKMKTVVLGVLIAGLSATISNASDITWQTPATISGASDVSTLGTYFGSWAPYDGSANSYPVNGVTFQGFSDLPGFSEGSTWDNGYSGFASPGTPNSNYNTLLQYATFSNESTPATLGWSGMTDGDTYLVELWVQDGRNSTTAERSETITGGANTSAALAYGSGVNGTSPGQYVIGTFVADDTGSETITVNPFGGTDIGPSAQINLVQVRDLTPVPEPSTLALLVAGVGAMLFGMNRKFRSA